VLSSILEVIELQAEMVDPVSFAETVCSDPDDDKFLEAALAAKPVHSGSRRALFSRCSQQ
jgi:predicted nucleic acid-binding protein